MDLENINPVRIELFFPRVFHYSPESDVTGDESVHQKVFCLVVVTPARNFSIAEYLRLYIVEGNTGVQDIATRKDILHEILLDQLGMCEHLRDPVVPYPDPLDCLNMPSQDYFPGNYLSIQLAYRKIQGKLRRSYGIDHRRIYVEGFSDTIHLIKKKDLALISHFHKEWSSSFYEHCVLFESTKAEERPAFKAMLHEPNPPWWPREGEPDPMDIDLSVMSPPPGGWFFCFCVPLILFLLIWHFGANKSRRGRRR